VAVCSGSSDDEPLSPAKADKREPHSTSADHQGANKCSIFTDFGTGCGQHERSAPARDDIAWEAPGWRQVHSPTDPYVRFMTTNRGRNGKRSTHGALRGAALVVAVLLASLLAAASHVSAQPADQPTNVVVYADQVLEPGFANWASAPNNLASTGQVFAGSTSIEASMGPGQAIFFGNYQLTTAPAGGAMEFSVHVAANARLALQVGDANGVFGPEVMVDAAAGQWTTIATPLADLPE